MAHRKAGGSAKSLKDSKPKYLGVKLADGQMAKEGAILVRQRGTKIIAGEGVRTGKDHTLYATKEGAVQYKEKRTKRFDGKMITKKEVSIN